MAEPSSYLRDVFTSVKQRVEERAKEEIVRRVDGSVPSAAPVAPPGARPPLAPVPIPKPEPPWPANIKLQGGRELRGTFVPAIASRRDVLALGQVCAENDRRSFGAIRRHEKTIRQLKQANEELAARVTAMEEQAGQTVSRLLDDLRNLESEFQRVRVRSQKSLNTARTARKLAARQRVELRSFANNAQIQNLTSVISNAQASAFGEKGNPFKGHNLVLAGNQLFWSLFDPILRRMGIVEGLETSAAAWLSPIGSLATGQLALANRQHVRFLSGTETFAGNVFSITRSLRNRIADSLWPEFQRRTDVPVSVTAVELRPSGQVPFSRVTAEVRQGILTLSLPTDLPAAFPVRVSWTIDLGEDIG